MAVIGGARHVWGAVIGAALLTVLKEWLQDLLPKLVGASGNFEMIVFGVLMMLLLQRAREGLDAALRALAPADALARSRPQPALALPQRARPRRARRSSRRAPRASTSAGSSRSTTCHSRCDAARSSA